MDVKKRNATQNDVAREAGVTRSMVSYVISGNTDRSVAPETKQHILDAIEKLGYRPNKAAQALQQGDVAFAAKNIGVVICNEEVFRRPFYSEILAGIHSGAHEAHYHVRFIRFFDELRNPVLFNNLIHQEEIGGIILVSTDQSIKSRDDFAVIERIKERIPLIVCVEWQCEGLSSVLFDRQNTAKKATEYLFRCGYTDIAYVGENDERVEGVEQVLQLHGLKSNPKEFYKAQAFNMEGGYEAMKSIYENKDIAVPRSIICGSDEVAIGLLHYLNEKNIAVPQEIAVISIDNIEMSAYTNPPLTTMNVQKTAMGKRAVEMIVNKTAGKDDDAVSISLPASIIQRKSC